MIDHVCHLKRDEDASPITFVHVTYEGETILPKTWLHY